MPAEFRLILTATFSSTAPRDTCYNALKNQVVAYAAAHPAELKRADMTRDDYYVQEVPVVSEKVV